MKRLPFRYIALFAILVLSTGVRTEAQPGGPGPFTDVLLLKFVNGAMVAFSQSHYVEIPGPTT